MNRRSGRRKICVVTGSRSEYGLLRWVMQEISESPKLDLQIIVTGTHLSQEFGMTIEEIKKDGFKPNSKVDMLLSSNTEVAVAKSMGLGVIGFSDALAGLDPDLLLLLGDRFEIFSVASVAVILGIPIAHIHGGEGSEGAIDEVFRHAISKMSSYHFASTAEYRKRLIQLGEQPNRVFIVGAPGLENIDRLKLLTRDEVEHAIDMKLGEKNLLVTYHPETTFPENTRFNFEVLLSALSDLKGVKLIFTKSNADVYGKTINKIIDKYIATKGDKAVAHASLGQQVYLSAMKYVDGVVGNSSSGIIEAPSLQTGTVNIGDRQRGRIRAASVIDCSPNKKSIKGALTNLFSQEYRINLQRVQNPYRKDHVAQNIVNKLSNVSLKNIRDKHFFDIEFELER